ncbi:Ferrochelatase-1, chloroplastic/mitochondrial, partial [Linum perenne]
SCSKAGAVQSVSYLSSGRSLPRDNLSSRVLSVGGLDRRRNVVTQSYAAPPASICPFDETSAVQNRTRTTEEKIGVLLLNLGGPESLNDVQPFLFNLFADPDIIRLPRLFQFLQRPLAQLISTLRAPKSKEGYAAIGGGSPLRKITDEQAYAIKDALQAKDVSVDVYVGMRYWYPFTEEAIQQIKKDRITKLVVLPLYPQFSISTTGSSLRVLQSIFRSCILFDPSALFSLKMDKIMPPFCILCILCNLQSFSFDALQGRCISFKTSCVHHTVMVSTTRLCKIYG